MLGLKRGTVKLVPHNKNWRTLYEKEKKRLEKGLGDLAVDIQHIGSTSILGLVAKPILDISIGVRRLKDGKMLVKPMKDLGYELSTRSRNPNEVLFVKGPIAKRTHYIHVIKYKGDIWKHDLLFRDYLRKHPGRANKYAELKKSLGKLYVNNRFAYTTGKKKFIRETLKIAKKSS